ncbi:MAG: hypothetical protein SGILL_004177 [Bacillariaceae sp.]
MPMIMHGSGDVVPWETNPESKMLLSQLTANYVSNLVEAAVDAHSILNGGRRPPLPPPPPVKAKDHRKPHLPAPYIWPSTTGTGASTAAAAASASLTAAAKASNKKKNTTKKDATAAAAGGPTNPENFKRRKRNVDYFDEPLPEPKIKNNNRGATAAAPTTTNKDIDGVPIGDWVGVAGVDFFEETRARSAHVAPPHAIGTQSFIFPVCHDSALYGKILDVQGAARRSLEPVLANATIRDVIRTEAALQGAGALRKRRRDKKSKLASSSSRGRTKGGGDDDDDDEDDVLDEDEDEPEATDSEDEDTGAVWPGLDELLPAHTTKDFFKSLM